MLPLVQSKKLGLGKLFSIVVRSTSVRQLQLLLGDTFSLVRIRVKFEAIFIALLFPWTSFCFQEFLTLNVFLFPGFLIYVHQSRIYVPRCLIYFLESHIHFPELFIELLERFGFLARCPEFMMYFHACSIWTIALTSLFVSLRSCCFLCSLFVSCIVYLYPEVHYYEGPHSSHPKCLNAKLFGSHFWCPIQTWLCFWARERAAEGSCSRYALGHLSRS